MTIASLFLALTAAVALAEVEVFEINYSKASSLEGPVRMLLSPSGKMSVDDGGNIIIISDKKANIEAMRELINRLDRPTKNILVNVEFVEESSLNQLGLTLKWRAEGPGWIVASQPLAGKGHGGAAVALGATAIHASLSGKKRQFMRIMENAQGRIFVGESVPFTDYFASFGASHGYVQRKTAFKNVGTSFAVKARRITGKKLEVELTPEVSYYDGEKRSFAVNNAATTLIVDDPGAVIIGGSDASQDSFTTNFLSGGESRETVSKLLMVLTVSSED